MHPQNQVKTLVSRVVHQKKAPGLLTICLKKKQKKKQNYFQQWIL